MISAKQAAEQTTSITNGVLEFALKEIENKIICACKQGKKCESYSILNKKWDSDVISALLEQLKDLGYKVDRVKDYDQRDREELKPLPEWDYLTISW